MMMLDLKYCIVMDHLNGGKKQGSLVYMYNICKYNDNVKNGFLKSMTFNFLCLSILGRKFVKTFFLNTSMLLKITLAI